jgi:cytochrome b pre-mRNA-processing protein 3
VPLLQRLIGRPNRRASLAPLYGAVVAVARDPFWYRVGGVPDSVEGRFDMVASATALVLLRLEAEGEKGREPAVLLTELFIDDMDASLRQIGIGDYVVGKHVGRLMSALGGRLAAFRAAGGDGCISAVRRNVFHEAPPSDEALAAVARRLERLERALAEAPLEALLEGRIGSW